MSMWGVLFGFACSSSTPERSLIPDTPVIVLPAVSATEVEGGFLWSLTPWPPPLGTQVQEPVAAEACLQEQYALGWPELARGEACLRALAADNRPSARVWISRMRAVPELDAGLLTSLDQWPDGTALTSHLQQIGLISATNSSPAADALEALQLEGHAVLTYGAIPDPSIAQLSGLWQIGNRGLVLIEKSNWYRANLPDTEDPYVILDITLGLFNAVLHDRQSEYRFAATRSGEVVYAPKQGLENAFKEGLLAGYRPEN